MSCNPISNPPKDDRADAKMGAFVYFTTLPVFVVVIFFKHDILHHMFPGPSSFLDKALWGSYGGV